MKKKTGIVLIIILLLLVATGCYIFTNSEKNHEPLDSLVIVSPHPIEFMIPLIQEFENETGITAIYVTHNQSEAYLNFEENTLYAL